MKEAKRRYLNDENDGVCVLMCNKQKKTKNACVCVCVCVFFFNFLCVCNFSLLCCST